MLKGEVSKTPRCGCQDACSCLIVAGDGIDVDGLGTIDRPYEISAESGVMSDSLIFDNSGNVDFSTSGFGTPASPLRVSANADTTASLSVLGWKFARDYGIDLTGNTTHTAAQVQVWLDAGAPYAAGTIKCSGTVTIKDNADLHLLKWNYTGTTGVAIQVGDPAATLTRKTILLPDLTATAKTANGWNQVAGTIGVQITNCYTCSITFPHITNFETGVLVTARPVGAAYQGTQHCSFYPLHLDNNKVNFAITPLQGTAQLDSGWSNQCTVVGGRFSHNSNEGVQVSGTRNLLISDCFNIINGWVFYNTSLETPDVVEYHVECFGQYIILDGCRFENTGGDTHRRVWSRGTAKSNWIRGGFNAGQITQVKDATALPFRRSDEVSTTMSGGGATVPTLIVENAFSSTAPALTIMGGGASLAGDSPDTAYAVRATAQKWSGKRPTDTNDRLQMDYLNGRVYVGDATAAPVGYIGGSPSAMFIGGSVPLCPLATGTQDLGVSGLQWRDLRLSRGIGAFGTAPPAVKPAVSGSRGGNAALASLLTALASFGLITDSTTA